MLVTNNYLLLKSDNYLREIGEKMKISKNCSNFLIMIFVENFKKIYPYIIDLK